MVFKNHVCMASSRNVSAKFEQISTIKWKRLDQLLGGFGKHRTASSDFGSVLNR